MIFSEFWKRYCMLIMHDDILTFLSNEISQINNKIILIKDSDELSLNKVHNYLLDRNSSNKCFYRDLKTKEEYEPYYPF